MNGSGEKAAGKATRQQPGQATRGPDTGEFLAGDDARLPEGLGPLFWDYDFGRLRWLRDRDLVTRRLLESGGLREFCWLRRRLGDRELRDWLIQHEGAGLSPQRLRFMELILGLPHKRVTSWLQSDSRKVWDKRAGP